MQIKKSVGMLILMSLLFMFFALPAYSLTVTLNACSSSQTGTLDSKNVTGSSYCINATFSDLIAGDTDGGATGGENVTQCVFSSTNGVTLGTNSTTFTNLSSGSPGGNASVFVWDTTARADINVTTVTVICTVNATGTTITDTASNVIIDNTVPTSTYAGETPRSGSTTDNDFVLLETAVDSTIVGCLLNISNTLVSTQVVVAFAPRRNKCTTEVVTQVKGLLDDATYTYRLGTNDGYNTSILAERTFTTNIRSVGQPSDTGVQEDREKDIGISIGLLATIIIIFILLVGGGGWYYIKTK